MMGTRYMTQTVVSISRGATDIDSVGSDANGTYLASITAPTTTATANVYSSYIPGVTASRGGQSVEQRADAGSGDYNIARAFDDRAVSASGSGVYITVNGEGFKSHETVALSDCATSSTTADSNGAFSIYLNLASTGAYHCTLTGVTSGRVAYASLLGDSQAVDLPTQQQHSPRPDGPDRLRGHHQPSLIA